METPKAFNLLLVSIVATACFAACAVKKSDKLKGADKNGAEKTAAVCQGGQPGLIQIQGAVMKGEGAESKLDERLRVTGIAGLAADGTAAALDKSSESKISSKITVEIATTGLAENRDYINLGCPDQSKSAAEGLNEVKMQADKDVNIQRVNRIFICGKVSLTAAFNTLAADAVFLQDADLSVAQDSPATLEIHANTLNIKGRSAIHTKGRKPQVGKLARSAGISLAVVKEIQGDGSLDVGSVGGDCSDKAAVVDEEVKPISPDFDINTEAMPK